jgi:hypothetical protein
MMYLSGIDLFVLEMAGGARCAPIAVIADIARNRKGKPPPRMNTDDTDQETGGCDGHRWD